MSDTGTYRSLSSWQEVINCLQEFPAPRLGFDAEGDVDEKAWVFRGVENANFELEPSIERISTEWAALEVKVSEEFKSRAQMHIRPPLIPTDALTWLALMQHYGIPTRLLDFTFSPFVAVYFAVRESKHERNCKEARDHVRVWAMDFQAINNEFRKSMAKFRKSRGNSAKSTGVPFGLVDFASKADVLKGDALTMRQLVASALGATGQLRGEMGEHGCVCAVRPHSFNPRLANQEGVFLLNCAEDLTFQKSLEKMMKDAQDWRKTFDIPVSLLPDVEKGLFQMNIHEQSLFPDLEGLAGLIRQKIRLHWKRICGPDA